MRIDKLHQTSVNWRNSAAWVWTSASRRRKRNSGCRPTGRRRLSCNPSRSHPRSFRAGTTSIQLSTEKERTFPMRHSNSRVAASSIRSTHLGELAWPLPLRLLVAMRPRARRQTTISRADHFRPREVRAGHRGASGRRQSERRETGRRARALRPSANRQRQEVAYLSQVGRIPESTRRRGRRRRSHRSWRPTDN